MMQHACAGRAQEWRQIPKKHLCPPGMPCSDVLGPEIANFYADQQQEFKERRNVTAREERRLKKCKF